MILLEYEAKELLRQHGVQTPKGILVTSEDMLDAAIRSIEPPVMIKAQVLHGGRGKQGLIVSAETPEQAFVEAARLLRLNTSGFGVLIEDKIPVQAESYVSFTVDGTAGRPSLLASYRGGIDVEQMARGGTSVLRTQSVDPIKGLDATESLDLLISAGWPERLVTPTADLISILYTLYWEADAELLEINPLIVTRREELVAADAKMSVDDSASFRHPDWTEWIDRKDHGILQDLAREAGLVFHDLDGDIAIVSMGAGITMALMDTIQSWGGRPANFLDATGGVGPEVSRRMMDLVLDKVARSLEVKAMILCSALTATSVRDIVEGFTSALDSRPSQVPIYSCIYAAAASLRHGSLESVLSSLASRGVVICDSLDEAAQRAVRTPQRRR